MFCEESYSTFPTWLSFITKFNSNQLNIKKKINEDNFGKEYYKKRKHKKIGKKPCEEKLYQSIVFCEEKLVFTCNYNS
jgi:NADH:ubiquinone oxidoreductase subunit